MSDIAFVHPSLNKMGGAEKMALDILDVLCEEGYKIHLYTIDKCDWEQIEQRWGTRPRPYKENFYTEKKIDPDNLYSWIKTGLTFIYIILKTYLVHPITINNYGEAFPYFSEISFFHAEPLYKQGKNPFNIPFWGFFRNIYEKTSSILKTRYCKGYFVTNSNFNAQRIFERYNKQSRIVHPFINQIPYYFNAKQGDILTISRITPGKHLYNLAPLTYYLPKQTFVLMGPNTPYADLVLTSLNKIKNLKIIKNPTRQEYEQIIRTSSIVLSTQPNEAFGISLLEAMSAGCIPIVHKDGGPWIDILNSTEGETGYAYTTVEEAVEKIKLVLWDETLRDKLRKNGVQRTEAFNKSKFQEDILRIMEEIKREPIEKTDIYYKFYAARKKVQNIKNFISAPIIHTNQNIKAILNEIREEYRELSQE